MAYVRVSHNLDTTQLQRQLNDPNGGLARELLRKGVLVEAAAKRRISSNPKRVDTGRLRNSIKHKLVRVRGNIACAVGTDVFYAQWVHDGTGIYGPRGTPIVPRKKRALAWKSKSGKIIIRKSVRGMAPNPFLKDGLRIAFSR